MEELISPETAKLEDENSIENGFVNVEIIRSMFDGKMAATLSGAGRASMGVANRCYLGGPNIF